MAAEYSWQHPIDGESHWIHIGLRSGEGIIKRKDIHDILYWLRKHNAEITLIDFQLVGAAWQGCEASAFARPFEPPPSHLSVWAVL